MISDTVPDVLAVVAGVRKHFGVHFAVDGQGVSEVERDRIENEHADHVESAGSHASIGESYIDTQVPTIHLLANQATGNMTTGTTISCVDWDLNKFLNFMRVLGDNLSSLIASTKSSHSQVDKAMSDGELL